MINGRYLSRILDILTQLETIFMDYILISSWITY